MKISTYTIIDKIATNDTKVIYRVKSQEGGHYILKQLLYSESTQGELDKLKKEIRVLKPMSPQYVVKAIELGEYEGSPFLVLEDKGGIALKSFLLQYTPSLIERIQMAISMAEAVNHVHVHNIIHCDVNPSNFIIDPQTRQIWINDFGVAESYSKRIRNLPNQHELRGTLDYISPEQTGRINTSVDFRTDIYALGVSFYEMFTGVLPFKSDDLLTNIHLHMTAVPVRPDLLHSTVPKQIGNIIMKMLSKEPIKRYQSVFGLIDDLKYCLNAMLQNDVIHEFELGSTDRYSYFNCSRRIYGRKNLILELNQVLRRCHQMQGQFILVEGESGIGKTHVMTQFIEGRQDIGALYGQFVTGDQSPYSAFVDAVRRYFKFKLLGSEEELQSFSKDLIRYLGVHIHLLTQLIPELIQFMGDQYIAEESLDVGYSETRFRFHAQFSELLKFLLSKEEKLVIVLDDFQHIDESSSTLLDYLIEKADLTGLVIIGLTLPAENHPTIEVLIQKYTGQLTFKYHRMGGFDLQDIQDLMHDLFGFEESQGQTLSDIVMSKTKGIPLFVYEVLKAFYINDIIYFDTQMARWDFILTGAKHFEISQNVIDLILKKIALLEQHHKQVLMVASCFETPFTFTSLKNVGGFEDNALTDSLMILIDNDFFEFDGQINDLILKPEGFGGIGLHFSHSNIRHVVNETIPSDERSLYAYKVGLALYRQYQSRNNPEQIPYIVRAFNRGRVYVIDKILKREIVSLNFLLAYQARSTAAFDQAHHYIQNAVSYLDESSFDDNYELSYRVVLLKAELGYLIRDFKRANSDIQYLIDKAKNNEDIARANKLRITMLINQGEPDHAVELALTTLNLLQVDVKRQGSVLSIIGMLLSFKMNATFNRIELLEKLPECNDKRIVLIMEILSTLVSASYLLSKLLFIQIILTMISLSLKHGNTVYSSFAYATYGILEGNLFNRFDRAYHYGELSIKLAKHFKKIEVISQSQFTMGFFLNHWQRHIREALPHLKSGREFSEKSGDMVYFAYNVAAYHLANLASSALLESILEEIQIDLKKINEVQVYDITNLLISVRQMVLCLKGRTTHYSRFDSQGFDQTLFETGLRESKMPSILAVYLVLKLKTHYIFDQFNEAFLIFEEGDKLFSNLMGLYQSVEYIFYQTLMLLKLNITDGRIIANIKKLKKYAMIAPSNFEHMYFMAMGERLRAIRHFDASKHYFDQALKACHLNDFLIEEALCCELIASIYDQEANIKLRKLYLFEAFKMYSQIGASGRLKLMEEKYKELSFHSKAIKSSVNTSLLSTNSIKVSSEKFDLMGIIKSTQSISAVTNEAQLIDETMRIIIQITNADRGVLILKESQFFIRAIMDGSTSSQIIKKPFTKDTDSVPITMVNHTLRQSEALVVDLMDKSSPFTKDGYFMVHPIKSALSLPILNKDRLMGVIYLENALMAGVFSMQRLEPIHVILAQFIISHENARLIESIENSEAQIRFHKNHLEELVSKRTSELSSIKSDLEEIMNNVDQGFMQFDHRGYVLDSYSKECIRFFGKRIEGLDFDALFSGFLKKNEEGFYKKIIKKIFEMGDAFSASVYMGLLPEQIEMNNRTIQMHYKLVSNTFHKRIIVIMTDITDKIRLEAEKEAEKHNLKKIVNIIKYRGNLKKNIEEFKRFFNGGATALIAGYNEPREALKEIYRIIHTFKGDFAQWGMVHLSDTMHALEEHLVQLNQRPVLTNENMQDLIENFNVEEIMAEEFDGVMEYTGRAFFESEEVLQISKRQIDEMVSSLSPELTEEGKNRLGQIVKRVQFVNAKDLLIQYQEYARVQADALGKKISGILVNGDSILIDQDIYYDFFKSLVHVIRNIVQYAIEPSDYRLTVGKLEAALITCDLQYTEEGFTLTISDDGAGIDLEAVANKAIELHLIDADSQYTEEDLLRILFMDGFSTSVEVSKLSGRGMGLSAVKDEVDKLGGKIQVETLQGEGTVFTFHIPLKHDLYFD